MDNILRKIIFILALDKKIVGLLGEIHEAEMNTAIKEVNGLLLNREELIQSLTDALNYYQARRTGLLEELVSLGLEELGEVSNFIQGLEDDKKLEMLMLITEIRERKEDTLNR